MSTKICYVGLTLSVSSMAVSSRTPEGHPNRCPICGNVVLIEPSLPAGDAPCPYCGHLLWWFQERYSDIREAITASTSFIDDLQADSLDVVELMMELEEKFEITIPDEEYEKIKTVGDAIMFIEQFRPGRPPT